MSQRRLADVIALTQSTESIRNISILAHVDHGKTTLADSLISSNYIINPKSAGKLRYLDNRRDEQERLITMKSSSISLLFPDKQNYLINLIDSPGHVDFSSEVASALRLCDGALILVDVVEGVRAQTVSVLRQSWQEGVRPLLVLNKIDRLYKKLQMDPAAAYYHLLNIIELVNSIVSKLLYETASKTQTTVDEQTEEAHTFNPAKGNVVFACAVDRWAFTLADFSAIYAQKMGFNPQTLRSYLWGEYFFNAKTKKVMTKAAGSQRPMFVDFVLDPIWKLYECTLGLRSKDKLNAMLKRIQVEISARELDAITTEPENTIAAVMSAWMPLATNVLRAVVRRLPSPANTGKAELLCPKLKHTHPDIFRSIAASDPSGPLVMFVPKVAPVDPIVQIVRTEEFNDKDTSVGYARVYSGTVRRGDQVHVIDSKGRVTQHVIKSLYLMMGQYLHPVHYMPAGGIVAIGPVKDTVLKTATISSEPDCPSLAPMPLLTSPFVKVSVSATQISDTAKVLEGLAALDKADNSVEVYSEENGETILATCGEVHLQRCIKDLEDLYARCPVVVSEPILSFRETVTETWRSTSVQDITPNQRATITLKALALPEAAVKFLESNERTIYKLTEYSSNLGLEEIAAFKAQFAATLQELPESVQELIKEHTLAFGPKRIGPNVLVYQTPTEGSGLFNRKPVVEEDGEAETSDSASLASDMNETTLVSALVGGFDLASIHGPLCNEPLRGVCFIIEDVKILGPDGLTDTYGPFHGQVISTTKDACRNAVMKNSPRLIEGVYTCSIQSPQSEIGKIYSFLHRRRGTIVEEEPQDSTDTLFIQAFLPVPESFRISDELWQITAGAALPQLSFSHWQVLDEDPLEVQRTQEELEEFGDQPLLENTAKKYINNVRRRKGLPTRELLIKHGEKQRTLGKNK